MVLSYTCKYQKFPILSIRYLVVAEGVIKSESVVLHVLSDAIYLVLRLMHLYLRVC